MTNSKIKLITFFVAQDGEVVYSQQKTRSGAGCGSDLLASIRKFRHIESRKMIDQCCEIQFYGVEDVSSNKSKD